MNNNRLHLIRPPILYTLCAAFLAFALADSALAQDWKYEPVFRVGGEYDDNSTLDPRTDEEVDLTGLLLNARVDIKYTSPVASFLLQPKVVSRNYNDDSVFDSDDYFLKSNYRRQAMKSTIGFRVDFEEQSVRRGERSDSDFEIEDPDELTNDDTGLVFRAGDRTKWRVSPYWEYQLTKASKIGVDFDYFDTQYDDVFAGILADYSDARLNLNYRRSLSNVTTWGLSLTGRRYDSDNISDEIDGYGLSAGLEHRLSETTQVRAMIGFEDTDQSGSESDAEVTGSVTLIRKLETIRLIAQYRRSVNGGGAATVSVRDSLNLNFRRRLNERISAGLGVRAYQTKGVSGEFSDVEDRNYVQLHSGLVWYLTRSIVVEADYRYTVIDRGDDFEGSANSNQVNLWFTYQPKTTPKI